MHCPKCEGTLERRTYNNDIVVHRCDACAGLWCKPDALEKMRAEWMSEAVLDTGDPRVGDRLNEIEDIECPEGHGRLTKTYDEDQTHIWFESCDTCGGIFLDAGEFTDLKFESLLDDIRAFFKRRRQV